MQHNSRITKEYLCFIWHACFKYGHLKANKLTGMPATLDNRDMIRVQAYRFRRFLLINIPRRVKMFTLWPLLFASRGKEPSSLMS